jgi:hypothetical protein
VSVPDVTGLLLAQRCMAGERQGHSLQATALVNEAYLRLINVQQMDWQNRAHFLAMAARLMRRILVDSARAQVRQSPDRRFPRVEIPVVVYLNRSSRVARNADGHLGGGRSGSCAHANDFTRDKAAESGAET